MKSFKEKLEQAVKAAGIQEQDIAAAIGMTKSGFSIMKKNETVKADMLKKISDALNVPVSYFFEDGDDTEVEFRANTAEGKAIYFDPKYVKLLERQVEELETELKEQKKTVRSLATTLEMLAGNQPQQAKTA